MLEIDLAIIIATFALAGLVKGVVGLGLPTISLALLTVAFDLTSAMALLLIPSFVTNLWQALAGNATFALVKRIGPFLMAASLTIFLGAQALAHFSTDVLSLLLGILITLYAVTCLIGFRLTFKPHQMTSSGLFLGSINGVLTGMTGSFVFPGVLYLQAINLSRDDLIQAMGMLFTVSTLALSLALQQNNLLTVEHGILSLVGLLPALAGMFLGQRIRQRLSEARFRRVFFCTLLLLGLYIMFQALVS